MNGKQNLAVQKLLNFSGVPSSTSDVQCTSDLVGKRSSKKLQSLNQTLRHWTPMAVPTFFIRSRFCALVCRTASMPGRISQAKTTASTAVVPRRTQYLFIILHLVA